MTTNTPYSNRNKDPKSSLYLLVGIMLIVGVLLLSDRCCNRESNDKEIIVKVAGKNFLESSILLEILAMKFEELGIEVERKHGDGGDDLFSKLGNGRIDAYVDYTGTVILKQAGDSINLNNPDAHTYDGINLLFEKKYGTSKNYMFMHPFSANNPFEMVMLRDSAKALLGDEFTLSKMSKIKLKDGFKAGVSRDFPFRLDGLPGLKRIYGIEWFSQYEIVTIHSEKYDMLRKGEIDIADGYHTDPPLFYRDQDFAIIKDDRGMFPDYYPMPIIKKDVLKKYPKITKALEQLSRRVTNEKIVTILHKAVDKKLTTEILKSKEKQEILQEIIRDELNIGIKPSSQSR